jgi:4-hydroxyacetophenone monooxygenase
VNRRKWPDIAGREDFQEKIMHTANYDPEVSLASKHVGIIGTGASAAQLISAISDNVGELTVFMRTRYWTIYKPEINAEVSDGMMFALRYIPHFREWFRFRVYWFAADGLYSNVVKDPKRPVDSPSVSALNEGMRQYALSQLEAKFADRPGLKEKMTPDFPPSPKASSSTLAGWTHLKNPTLCWKMPPRRQICVRCHDRFAMSGLQFNIEGRNLFSAMVYEERGRGLIARRASSLGQ